MIRQKAWPPGGGAYFPYISIKKTLKIFLSETNGLISILLDRNVSLVILYQDCSSCYDSLKNMAARDGAYFPYISIYKIKNLFVKNHWTDFNIT